MINDNVGSLFQPDPSTPAAMSLRQGILQSWNPATGENQIAVAGGVLVNIPVLTSEAVSLTVGDVVSLSTDGTRWRLDGLLTTPGDPGTVPTWPTDITALDESVATINTVTIPGVQADVFTAQTTADGAATDASAAVVTADAAAADASTALSKFPITETDIQDGSISTPKLSADAIDGLTITGNWIRTATSGKRIGLNDPAYPNSMVFYTGGAGEIEPAGLLPSDNGGTLHVRLSGPKVTAPDAPATFDLYSNNGVVTPGASSADLDADNIHLFGTLTTINGFSSLKLGDGTDYITIAGQTVTDADLSSSTNTYHGQMLTQNLAAACTSNVALQTTEGDITGATVTFSTTRPNARYMCTGSFYFSATAANANVAAGKLSVDGTNQAAWAQFTGSNTVPDRVTASQSWTGTLASAGSHTLKLRGVHANANNVVTVNASHTTITVMVFE